MSLFNVNNFIFGSEQHLFSSLSFLKALFIYYVISLQKPLKSIVNDLLKDCRRNRQYRYRLIILRIIHFPSFVYWTYWTFFKVVEEDTSFQCYGMT